MRLIRRLKIWRRRQERNKHALRKTYLYHLLGERIFHNQVWVFDKKSVAGGLSLGLFVALSPTIPFQMLLCAIAAVPLRVNLPIALAACWITNPLTAPAIYFYAHKLGRYLLDHTRIVDFALGPFGFESRIGKFMELNLFLWTGCLLFASVSAVLGNVVVRITWNWQHTRKVGRNRHGDS